MPITEAHRQGVTDPMTGALARIPGAGDMRVAEACQRKIAVFDGRMRYDLQLAFKRMDNVQAKKGYSGPVVVCSIYFTPIAGHVPGPLRDQISDQGARRRSVAGAGRRHAGDGAVPDPDGDAAGHGHR